MKKYSVVQIGLGAHWNYPFKGISKSSRPNRDFGDLRPATGPFESCGKTVSNSKEHWYTNLAEMVETLRPDILSFCTLPSTRVELVQLAARTSVKKRCVWKNL